MQASQVTSSSWQTALQGQHNTSKQHMLDGNYVDQRKACTSCRRGHLGLTCPLKNKLV